jgi:hypothetical protein
MGGDGIGQIEKESMLLAGSGDGEYASDEAAPSGALGTIRAFAPQNNWT